MTFPQVELPILPLSTIVPKPSEEVTFVQYMMRLYEDLAFAINYKDFTFFEIAVSDVAADIPNIPNFGAFLVCVSGTDSTLPTLTASLCKSDATAVGQAIAIGQQVGTGAWAGNSLTIASTATNFQISHDRAGVTANFNIRIIGTQ